ncbi:MAG: hypothetical protein RIQ53_799 [Pseudomonadota bacterium]|jgi:HD-GYP domain-containing protein (c-di-GMP phosphodiesterase class II)
MTQQFSPLSLVQHRIVLGQPLPFNVRDHDRTLLLAKGQLLRTPAQLQALMQRGALVDLAELQSQADALRMAKPQELPRMWKRCLDQLGESLLRAGEAGFRETVEEAAGPVRALIERDPDLAIFQVLRPADNPLLKYGTDHAVHAAICTQLVARRLGWEEADVQRAFKTALTMNVGMLELQGLLATQTTPPTPEQRRAIHAHPIESRRLLELGGVSDADWLRAVEDHHETADGQGYPKGLREVGDIAALVHRADVYTAKLSPRAGREAMAADQAGRQMFMQDQGHPMTAALVKEFGVYPPGCWVRLTNGECGIVVRRGPTVMTPVVAVMTTAGGQTLSRPVRRDTSQAGQAVQGLMQGAARPLTISTAELMGVAET